MSDKNPEYYTTQINLFSEAIHAEQTARLVLDRDNGKIKELREDNRRNSFINKSKRWGKY